MRRLPTPLLILLFVILLLAVIFLAVDFKAAGSTTRADSQLATIRSGDHYDQSPPLVVYVEAPRNLEDHVRQALFNQLGTIIPWATMKLIDTPEPTSGSEAFPADSAALVVVVDRPIYIWTPVYARADLRVRVAFASDGRVDWNQLGEVETVTQDSPTVRVSGELGIQDRTVGLISFPGYRSHIAQEISDRVVIALKNALVSTP